MNEGEDARDASARVSTVGIPVCAFAYIFISPASAQGSSISYRGPLYIQLSYLKRLTMAIAMVGGGDDTGGSGCARDRLGESLGAGEGEGEGGGTEGRDVGERVTESGTARAGEPRKETENTGSGTRMEETERYRDGGGKGGGIGRKQQ